MVECKRRAPAVTSGGEYGRTRAALLRRRSLARPPPVRGKLPRWLLKVLENGEVVTFMAIAVALLAIAIVVFVSGSTTSWWRRGGGRAVRLPGPGAALRQGRRRLPAAGSGSPA